MNKIKIQQPKCDKCGQTATKYQIVRFMWQKRNAYLDLCPTCFQKMYQGHLKEIKISKETMVRSGYYEEGAREVDFKHYLEKWSKQVKDQL